MNFVLKGDILYCNNANSVSENLNSYLVCIDGKSEGVFKKLPDKYKKLKLYDYTGHMIIPGLIDLHLHAPQYAYVGLHMDLKLLDWLTKYTFPEESKYKNIEYAKKAYDILANDLKYMPTTRFSMFATIHNEATLYLMKKLDKMGFKGYVGKVNMDRNSPKILIETTKKSMEDTIDYIERSSKLKNIKPIVTPRFIPSCSDELMSALSSIVKKYKVPVQSHLSENLAEIEWVKELSKCKTYEEAYDKFDMMGTVTNTIMAHYVWPDERGIKFVKGRKVWIAHSPSSNRNLASGIAPISRYLKKGIKVGLATDVAGGSYLSMFRAMEDAITASKMRECLIDKSNSIENNINIKQAFFLATLGGGSFFGKVGSFKKGYEFDAIVLDESKIPTVLMDKLKLLERFERFVYRPCDKVKAKFIAGNKVV